MDGGGYGKPKELWKGHFNSSSKTPESGEQFEQFFINASSWIMARGNRIAITIKGKMEGKSDQELENLAERMMGELA